MGRRRKNQDAGGGLLLLLGISAFVALFILRLAVTILLFAIVPCIVMTWLSTIAPRRKLAIGDPLQFDHPVAWSEIEKLLYERQRQFTILRNTYTKGFENELSLTAKSENRLFHAGSKFGKHLNFVLENTYNELDSLSQQIFVLRSNVIYQIPNWRSSFENYALYVRLHRASGALVIILLTITSIFHAFPVLQPEFTDGAARALLWNPNPILISGDLVLSAGATAISALLVWPLTNKNILHGADLTSFQKWQAIEQKWFEPIENAEFDFT